MSEKAAERRPFSLQGCTLHPQRPKPKPKPKRLWGVPWRGGEVSDGGGAVNPSLGAWPRHPCRGHPAIRHLPAFDSFPVTVGKSRSPVGVDLGRHDRSTPCVDEICQVSKGVGVGPTGSNPECSFCLCSCSSFFFPWRAEPPECVKGRAAGAGGGVRGMDAAAKPPGTGLRRPPPAPAVRPSPPTQPGLSATNPTPATRGCAVG